MSRKRSNQGTAGEARFRHEDGSSYGAVKRPEVSDVFTKVSAALRNLGFREREIATALEELRETPDVQSAKAEHLLRKALSRLTST